MRAETGRKGDAYVLKADGTLVRITDTKPEYGTPIFSPDGKRLLIQLPTPNGMRLHVVAADGSGKPVRIEFR